MNFKIFLATTLGTTSVGVFTLLIFSSGSIASSKRTVPHRQLTLSEVSKNADLQNREDAIRDLFERGEFFSVRSYFEPIQNRAEVKKRSFKIAYSNASDATIPLASCDIAEGHPSAALVRYENAVKNYPDGISDLSGRMFYAAHLTGRPEEVERIVSLLESKTYADPSYYAYRSRDKLAPKDSRTRTLLHIIKSLAEDRNRTGFEAAVALANRSSNFHPAVLDLELGILKGTFRDYVRFRSLGLTITNAQVEAFPSLSTDRRYALWFSEYERRYPLHWQTMLRREHVKFIKEKRDAVRTAFAYEASYSPLRINP